MEEVGGNGKGPGDEERRDGIEGHGGGGGDCAGNERVTAHEADGVVASCKEWATSQ